MVCLVGWLTTNLVRIEAWATLVCFHKANPWLFGCLCFLSLASPKVYLVAWFVLIQSPLLPMGKVTPLRHFVKQVMGILVVHRTAAAAASSSFPRLLPHRGRQLGFQNLRCGVGNLL